MMQSFISEGNYMSNFFNATAALILLAPGMAFAQIGLGDPLGSNEEEIRNSLVDLGFEITEYEVENGIAEVEVLLDRIAQEIEVSLDNGAIIEIEFEDEDDDDENDG